MAVILTPQADIEKYFDAPEVNQSSLKDLEYGFDSFMAALAKKEKDKAEGKPTPDYFLIGGAVDTILTGEVGEFEKNYYVSNLEKTPSDAEVLIIRQVFDELVANEVEIDLPLTGYLDQLAIAITDQDWYKGNPGEKRTQGLIERGLEYFEDLKNSFGKKILTSDMRYKIDLITNSLRTNPKTKKYFDREAQSGISNMDFYYQLPIYFTYKGIACKALMDLVVVHKDDYGVITKIEPIDLKTMSGNTLQFITKVKQHRYDIQAAWYTEAVIQYFKVPAEIVEPFKFIVESTTNVGSPLVFRITNNTLLHGKFGSPEGIFKSESGEREIIYADVKGYEQLIDSYAYYSEQGFKQDKILDEHPDIIEIDYHKGI